MFESADISIPPQARLCLVGRNGSGKSTLLKIIAGQIEIDGGVRFVKPGTTIGVLEQSPDLTGFANVKEFIDAGLDGLNNAANVNYLMDALLVNGEANPAQISGGEARRAALVKVLANEPDILLLDEPTNHLDLPAIDWLENHLARLKSAIVLISHDRRFLQKLGHKTIWVDRGRTYFLDKNFKYFEDWRDEFFKQEEIAKHKLNRKIIREQHWIIHGVSGRRKRNIRRLKQLQQLRTQKQNTRQSQNMAQISQSKPNSSGRLVALLRNVSKSYNNKKLIDNFSLKIMRGARIGIVGPNGAGKSTLLKLIIGEIMPDSGKIKHGVNIEPLFIDQNRNTVSMDTPLGEALSGDSSEHIIIDGKQKHIISYMKDYLFLPEQRTTPIAKLSGGERARLALARGLRLPSNLLILDEPTNDLDLETLDLLQELIAEYEGTVILVSHDRDFLDRTVDTIIAFESNGNWVQYAGGYSDMLRQKNKPDNISNPAKTTKKPDKPARNKKANKLSYKHKYRLETLPGIIADKQEEIAKIKLFLSKPDAYTKDSDKFNEMAKSLTKAEQELSSLENEWLEIELLKESLSD